MGGAFASPVGHLSAILDAGGWPIRRTRGRLDLRRQHDSLFYLSAIAICLPPNEIAVARARQTDVSNSRSSPRPRVLSMVTSLFGLSSQSCLSTRGARCLATVAAKKSWTVPMSLIRKAVIPSRVGPVPQVPAPVATAEGPGWAGEDFFRAIVVKTTAHQARSSQ
jgi:hypothetical protein